MGQPKTPEAIGELFEDATALLSMKNDGLTISTKVGNE
jgi:hypothetical protein